MPYQQVRYHSSQQGEEPGGGGFTSYSYSFGTTESPLSDGGKWTRAANSFTDVAVESGEAYGTQPANDEYDDAYARLSGYSGGNNYRIIVTFFVDPGINRSLNLECELHFHMTDDASGCYSNEGLFAHTGHFQLMKWNGQPSDPGDYFEQLALDSGGDAPLQFETGDRARVDIIDGVATFFVDYGGGWLQIAESSSAAMWASGDPGIAFFRVSAANPRHFTITDFSVEELP